MDHPTKQAKLEPIVKLLQEVANVAAFAAKVVLDYQADGDSGHKTDVAQFIHTTQIRLLAGVKFSTPEIFRDARLDLENIELGRPLLNQIKPERKGAHEMTIDNAVNQRPWRGFRAIDRIKTIQTLLESAKRERKTVVDAAEKALSDARARGLTGHILEQYQRRLDDADARTAKTIRLLEDELAALQDEINLEQNAKRQAAAHELAMQKAAAREAWLNHGGTPDDFERTWPSMAEDLLRQAVMSESVDLVKQKKIQDLGSYSL